MKKGILCLFFVMTHVFAQSPVTKVIELHYLPANQVIELMQPLIMPGERISGQGQTLLLKVTPKTLTDIRKILHQIDVPPVTLSISIHQGDSNWLKERSSDMVYSTHASSESPMNQTVMVLNGQTALVSTQEQVPLIRALGYGFYTGIVYQQHRVNTGLLIHPLIQGEQVRLNVQRIRQQQNKAYNQQFSEQQIDTTLMVPVNKWVYLGNPAGSDADDNATTYSTNPSFIKKAILYIKVSVVKP